MRLHLKPFQSTRSNKLCLQAGSTRKGRARAITAISALKARWCIDIRYGVKMEAISLVQDWIQTIGRSAGLKAANTNLLSGAVGAAESRLELEVEFESLALFEEFWSAIPAVEHKAWSQRARNFIIDGSPRWEIYRTCPVFATPPSPAAPSIEAIPEPQEPDAVSATLKAWEAAEAARMAASKPNPSILEEYLKRAGDASGSSSSSLAGLDEPSTLDGTGKRMAIDWKGDPMIINPGDNMPLF